MTQQYKPQDLLTPQQLQALGLGDVGDVGASEICALPEIGSGTTHALASEDAPRLPLEQFSQEARWLENIGAYSWVPVFATPTTLKLGLEISHARESPELWTFHQLQGMPLHIRAGHSEDSTKGVVRDPDNRQTLYVDMNLAGNSLRVETQRGALLLLRQEDQCLTWPVATRALTLTPIASITAPIEAWLKDCEDSWLKDHLRPYLHGGVWDQAASAGLYGRLYQHSPDQLRQARDSILSGSMDSVVHRPWVWASSLDENQANTLERLFITEANMLLEEILELDDDEGQWPLSDPSWLAQWHRSLRRRDDMESVASLLRHHPRGRAQLDAVTVDLDEQGELMARSFPMFEEIVTDERLLRAADLNPDWWWTIPAQE